MKKLFADAVYLVALAHRKDQWHERAMEISGRLGPTQLVITDEVLNEYLNFFSESGRQMRLQCASTVRDLLADPNVHVVPQSRQSFLSGLTLYESRADKGYSLTDCIAMVTMRAQGITEILTHDAHFTQEGFTILL